MIRAALEQRRRFVESKRGTGHEAAVNEILYLLGEAEVTLLNREMRRDYDRRLGLFEKRRRLRQIDPHAPRARFKSRPGPTVGEEPWFVRTFAGIMAVLVVGMGLVMLMSGQLPWGAKAEKRKAVAGPESASDVASSVAESPGSATAAVAPFAGWQFFDVYGNGLTAERTLSVEADGSLNCRGGNGSYCLFSPQEFTTFTLRLDYRMPKGFFGDPFVAVAARLPNPAADSFLGKFPFGIEVKLTPTEAGRIVLPRADFSTGLPAERLAPQDPRSVPRMMQPAAPASDWHRLEIDCDADRNVVVRINGVTVNRLDAVELTTGHIILWPGQATLGIRNAVLIRDGVETPLPFDGLASTPDTDSSAALPEPVLYLPCDPTVPSVPRSLVWIKKGGVYDGGKVGSGLWFTGDGIAEVAVPLPTGNAPRTLAVWLKNDRGPVDDVIHVITYGPIEGARPFGIMEAKRTWNCFDFNGGLDSGVPIDRVWHHHAITSDGTAIRYYFDGRHLTTVSRSLSTVQGNLLIGGLGDRANFVGTIDELYIYDRALTPEQIGRVMNLGAADR